MQTQLDISPTQNYVPAKKVAIAKEMRNLLYDFIAANNHKHPIFWIYDFIHLFKTIRNHLLDDIVELPCGSKVSVYDFYALLDKFRADTSDHTSGFHISEDHLEIESSDRQDVKMAMELISERTAVGFQKYFPKDKAKQALAKFILCLANAFKVGSSRVKYDSKDHLHSALGGEFFEVIFHQPTFVYNSV